MSCSGEGGEGSSEREGPGYCFVPIGMERVSKKVGKKGKKVEMEVEKEFPFHAVIIQTFLGHPMR